MELAVCPVCSREADSEYPKGGIEHIICSRCGEYFIGFRTRNVLNAEYDSKRHILSGILREAFEDERPITITVGNIDEIFNSASVPEGPLEAIDRIIQYVKNKGDTSASKVPINSHHDYPIAYAKDMREFSFYLDKACKLSLLENCKNYRYRLTIEGWKRLDELKGKQVDSNKAFVAMWFPDEKKQPDWKKKLDAAYTEGFEPALDNTGYKPIKIDLVPHNDKICEQIIKEIRKSGLLVADLTGHRGGVYYEAGFAKGLGIEVIWACHEDYKEGLHFDIRQYFHLFWETPQDLKKKLINRIEGSGLSRKRA